MNHETRLDYLVGVFGFMQLSLVDLKLLNEKGIAPKKRNKMSADDQDTLKIYDWVCDELRQFSSVGLKPRARIMDQRVKKLINNHTVVNNYLLSLYLLRQYIDHDATVMEACVIGPKINRMVDVIDKSVIEGDFDPAIKRATWRTAKNLYSQYIGWVMLSDEAFDNKFTFGRKA